MLLAFLFMGLLFPAHSALAVSLPSSQAEHSCCTGDMKSCHGCGEKQAPASCCLVSFVFPLNLEETRRPLLVQPSGALLTSHPVFAAGRSEEPLSPPPRA